MLQKMDDDYYHHDFNHDYDKCSDAVNCPCVGLTKMDPNDGWPIKQDKKDFFF